MSRSLIVVESPAKTKTLKNFLGSDFSVEASMGHVRDLPKSKLGVEVDKDFEPQYVTIPERRDTLKRIKEAAKKVDVVYLASDPDREGEAIAWHLCEALKLDSVKRVRFNEITKSAVLEGIDSANSINMDLVNAQQARRVLDRLVGYKLSPLLWVKVKKNLSAGRVQSVAVRLICDREREIDAFVPEEYWSLTATLTPKPKEHLFDAKLVQRAGKKVDIHNQGEADELLKVLEGAEYRVESVKKSEKRRQPPVPFITSTLQQEASRKLGFGARRTMVVAQQLYEGIELGPEGAVGLITYMRTDSSRVAAEAQGEARAFIKAQYGAEYVPEKPRQVARKGAQDAHEAIRPTLTARHPDALKQYLNADQYRLYKLIWQRFVASQMTPAVFNVVTVNISAADMIFRAVGSTVKFQGFMKVYTEGRDDAKLTDEEDQPPLPEMHQNEILDLRKLNPQQHFTEPPPRYTEATLVRTLEEKGIGRPSTYASIISTIQDRKYVELLEKKFRPTELGYAVTDQLVKHFPDIMDAAFTAEIETRLDNVEEGQLNWVKLLSDFYGPFVKELEAAQQNMERVKLQPRESDEVCPNCGKKMLIRDGRFGEFLGCSGYPECKTTMPITKKLNVKCPVCGEGEVLEKMSRKKKVFFGCSRYPDCTYTTWDKPTDKKCPKCGMPLGERRFKGRMMGYRCTGAECDYEQSRGKANSDAENTDSANVDQEAKA